MGRQVRNLQCDVAIQPQVPGEVDRTHAALAEELLQLVVPEPRRQLRRQATDPGQRRLARRGGMRVQRRRRKYGLLLLAHGECGLAATTGSGATLWHARGISEMRIHSGGY